MSKYYKAEDVIRKRAEDLADTSYWEYGNPKNVDDWIEVAEMEFKDLPTIEVSDEQLSKLKSRENSVENTTVSEDFTSISRANSKLEVSEDCISKGYLEQEIENQAMTVEKDKEYWRGWNNALDKVVELIEDAPSVVPKQVTGKLADELNASVTQDSTKEQDKKSK